VVRARMREAGVGEAVPTPAWPRQDLCLTAD
jgi:hypothetical protein